ncbi:hypothetical protein H310_11797 [Aphanomyces invadans]|uniref:BTB domain-containing protein n=1 Tax=Aphanomyces invadans TaxID=157072 RepID=A0A024TKB7_9STRA|nr:hypothetical protein H310_11797 [Aphanomyces invadans]ETV94473.1 hypothetical protein H310_11797 [Aphanomyces invadans]|eukprot:XP_008876788.1 hypothetical protein H310_11797 [Aphanomyces invadans]
MPDPWFFHRVHEGVREVFEQRLLTDVTLCVGSKRIRAHRLVLALHSPYFRAMFTIGMKECHTNEVHVDMVDTQAMDSILEYMYSGRDVTLDGGNMWPLLAACDLFDMDVLVDACCAKMALELRLDNCVNILACCDAFQGRETCAILCSVASTFVTTYFHAIYMTESFQNLPVALLQSILTSPMLCVHDELDVVTALLHWVEFDSANRQGHLKPLLNSCVHPNALNFSAPAWSHLSARLRCHSIHQWPSVRKPTRGLSIDARPDTTRLSTIPVIVALGGVAGRSISRSTEYLDAISNSWKSFVPMQCRRAHFSAVAIGNQLYVLGGYTTRRAVDPDASMQTHLNSMDVLHLGTRQWSKAPPMAHARSYLGAVHVDGYLYAIGGFDGRRHFACTELFSVATRTWKHGPPMHHNRSGLAIAAVHGRGKIVTCGGFDGARHLRSVEVLDTATNQWSLVASMHSIRNGGAAVALASGYIYVFGGEVAHGSRITTGEMYHVPSNVWAPSAPLPAGVSGHGAALWQHQYVYSIGGSTDTEDAGATQVDCVQRFDGVTHKWTPLPWLHLNRPRTGHAVVTIEVDPRWFMQRNVEKMM